ncbi:hypothetical protein M0805_004702 [Coniferiporia weirii]|nr:hypothetical protein M0805_004702 [Coniferiporia weirii]
MSFHNFPQDPVTPVYATPHFYPQPMPVPLVAVRTPASVWPSAPEVPDRPPDLMEWNDVHGGRLQWTPHPWVAHPLPHPQIPAHQFWSHAGGAGALQAWRTPGGGIPTPGFEMARAHQITGGHPLPGTDPFWTPTRRPVPLGTPYVGPGVFLSSWLAPNARNAGAPHVLWDAAVEPPYRIRRVTGRGGIVDLASTDFFKEPATDPSATTLQVHLPGMRSTWGPVVVKKSSGSAVSVGDVFQAVWNYLHKPISHDDYMAISATGGRQRCRSIEYAMYRRCLNSAALYDYTFSQGIKRVDLLEGNTVYWGTWLGYNPDGTWFLSMGFMPPTQLV